MPESPSAPNASAPPPKDWAKSLLGWYYSPAGTLIRVVFYVAVIVLVYLWSRGTFNTAKPTSRNLDHLDVIAWQEKRWAADVPPSTKLNEFPYIEVTLAEPEGYGVQYQLKDLAGLLRLYTPDASHRLLSLPIETFDATDAPGARSDDATKPRSFNQQIIVSFLVDPEALNNLPPELWLGYTDPGADATSGGLPKPPSVVHLGTLTTANFKGVQLRKISPAPTVPTPDATTVPAPAPAPVPAPAPLGPERPADPAPAPAPAPVP